MNFLKNIIGIFIVLLAYNSFSQTVDNQVDKKLDIVEIQTSAQCEMCKERIEKDMAFVKGVKSVELDLETKILKVKYKTNKTNVKNLRKAVAEIGYDADDVKAAKEAYDKLPDCCKKGGHD